MNHQDYLVMREQTETLLEEVRLLKSRVFWIELGFKVLVFIIAISCLLYVGN